MQRSVEVQATRLETTGRAGHIGVVTDSVASIPAALAQEVGIFVVPLHIRFGDEAFMEHVDLSNHQFYGRLRASPVLPKTSQPSAGEFLLVYREVARRASAILSIHASAALSGTFGTANTAARMLRAEERGVVIEVLDTQQVGLAEAIVALRAAEDAAGGLPFDVVVSNARALIPKTRLLLALETLDYLQAGGRLGRAGALLGALLHVRPILTIVGGQVVAKHRSRTSAGAMERMIGLMSDYAGGRPFGHVGVLHADAAGAGQRLTHMIRERFVVERYLEAEIGAVLGTYVGPGAFGVTFHCD